MSSFDIPTIFLGFPALGFPVFSLQACEAGALSCFQHRNTIVGDDGFKDPTKIQQRTGQH